MSGRVCDSFQLFPFQVGFYLALSSVGSGRLMEVTQVFMERGVWLKQCPLIGDPSQTASPVITAAV